MRPEKRILVVVGFIATMGFFACGEGSKKEIKAEKDAEEKIKISLEKDWEKFKAESEIAIDNTETEINSIRNKITEVGIDQQAKIKNDLDTLERKNKRLKRKLADRSREFKENLIEFNEAAKKGQKAFEREFKHDMDELGTAIKNLFKDNVE